jgi:cation transport regulator ChaC
MSGNKDGGLSPPQCFPGPVPVEPLVFTGKPGELYYFAYGSNMNKAQMHARCVRPEAIAVAMLPHYQLGFFGHSPTWDGALETVVPAPGQEVWGVIYDLSASDRERLDVWHDVRLDGTGAYFHYPLRITDTEGKTRVVLFYKKARMDSPEKPSREYLDLIVQGAVEHGLPAGYVEGLRRIESKKASYPVPKQRNAGRELLVETYCSQCGEGAAPGDLV